MGELSLWEMFLVAAMAVNTVITLTTELRSLTMFRRINIKIIIESLIVAITVVVISIVLYHTHWTLRVSWWWLLGKEGTFTSGIPLEGNLFRKIFIVLFLFNLPSFALWEEKIFREGTTDWLEGLIRSLFFGIVHMILGIPIASALAISIAGLWFTYQYFRGGIELSALYHLHYNLVLVVGGISLD